MNNIPKTTDTSKPGARLQFRPRTEQVLYGLFENPGRRGVAIEPDTDLAADIFADGWGDIDALDYDDPYAQNGLSESSGPRCPLKAPRTLTLARNRVYRWFDPRRWIGSPTLSVRVSN